MDNTIAHFVLRIPRITLEQARLLAEADARSINWFVCHAVEEAIRRGNHNLEIRQAVKVLQVEPDVDIIRQRRDGKGRFTRRSVKQEKAVNGDSSGDNINQGVPPVHQV